MPEDTLTVRVDPSNSFDVLSRLGGASDRLGQSGDRIGAGFIRGDRVVRTATGNITRSLLTASSASDVAAASFEGLERVFRIGIGATVGVAAGVAGFVAIERQITKTAESTKALGKELSKTFSTQSALGASELATEIGAISKATDDAEKNTQGLVAFFARQFTPGPQSPIKGLGSTMTAGQFQQQQIQAGFQRENQLRLASAETEERIVGIKEKQLEQGKDATALEKVQIDHQNQIAKIMLSVPFGPLTEASQKLVDNADKQLRIETALLGIENSRAKQAKLLSQQQDTGKQATDFFTDLGSGKFAKDFADKQRTDFQQQAGRDLAKRIEEGQAKGFFQDPLSQAALKEAQRISDRAGTSVTDLANTDFSNLLELSKYDFSGLQPLSGLTLSIQ